MLLEVQQTRRKPFVVERISRQHHYVTCDIIVHGQKVVYRPAARPRRSLFEMFSAVSCVTLLKQLRTNTLSYRGCSMAPSRFHSWGRNKGLSGVVDAIEGSDNGNTAQAVAHGIALTHEVLHRPISIANLR